jgi:hemin uptake protein HemP
MNALSPTRPQPDAAAPAAIPVHDARDLTANSDRARIVLDDKVYDLRITRAGKLILTK